MSDRPDGPMDVILASEELSPGRKYKVEVQSRQCVTLEGNLKKAAR